MDEMGSISRNAPGRSCLACRKRKIKCDREQPCSYCDKLGLSCLYPDLNSQEKERPASDVSSRLKRIEDVLERLELKLSDSESPHHQTSASGSRSNVASQMFVPKDIPGGGKLICDKGNGRYVANGFWADLDEAEKKETVLPDQSASASGLPPIPISTAMLAPHGVPSTFLRPNQDLHELYISTERLLTLWQMFIERVDPVLKLLHVPSIQRQLLWASQNLAQTPPTFGSLIFSICFAAVTSIHSSVNCPMFQRDRQALLDQYRIGLEQKLAQANFLSCPDVTILQALTLYLTCARSSMDKSYVWSMVALLIRLATKIGLHRDPQELSLSPFMIEIRRRLWWQIYVLDVRTAEDSDMDPFICEHSFNTKFPTNVNDTDLELEMVNFPAPANYRTEMLFTLCRIEVSVAARQFIFSPHTAAYNQHRNLSLKEKSQRLQDLVTKLEDKYLKDCDPEVPICVLTQTATRMILTKMKLTMNHPSRNEPSAISGANLQNLASSSVEILEGVHQLRTHNKYSRWVWLFEKYVDWDAAAFLLHILGRIALDIPIERVCNAITRFFGHWRSRAPDLERWQRLERLCENAMTRVGVQDWTSSEILTQENEAATIDANTSFEDFLELGNMSQPMECDVGSSHTNARNTATESHTIGISTGQGNLDWNFDDLSFQQPMPNWEMEFDDDMFKFNVPS